MIELEETDYNLIKKEIEMKPKIVENATELQNIATEISYFESTTTQPIFQSEPSVDSVEKRVEPKIKEKLGLNEISTATKNDTFENLATEEISDFEDNKRRYMMLLNFESTTTQPIFENPSVENWVEPKIKEKLGQNEINTATKNDTSEVNIVFCTHCIFVTIQNQM